MKSIEVRPSRVNGKSANSIRKNSGKRRKEDGRYCSCLGIESPNKRKKETHHCYTKEWMEKEVAQERKKDEVVEIQVDVGGFFERCWRIAGVISGLMMVGCLVLSEESLCEPVESTRFRDGNLELQISSSISSTSSCLNWAPKNLFIESTICPGSHVGRVQAETVL
jgi:hypothetical protein